MMRPTYLPTYLPSYRQQLNRTLVYSTPPRRRNMRKALGVTERMQACSDTKNVPLSTPLPPSCHGGAPAKSVESSDNMDAERNYLSVTGRAPSEPSATQGGQGRTRAFLE